MLKAHGEYILPDNVPANEFLNLEGKKLSTSRNWAVWLHEYLQDFPNMQDVLRYVLTANAPETKDNDFTWKDFQARNNNELVAIFGNFVNRVIVLTHKYFEGTIPAVAHLSETDKEVLSALSGFPGQISDSLERFRFREGLQELMSLARLGNKYLADEEPWKVIKEDRERVGTILNTALQLAAGLAVLAEPFLPFTSEKLKGILNFKSLSASPTWGSLREKTDTLPSGHPIGPAELLFRKIEDSEVDAQLHKLMQTKKENEMSDTPLLPQKETIDYETFSKMDLRVGTIVSAEKMPKTKKLIVMKVDTGLDTRTIISGIAEHYEPESLVGKKVTVLVNLTPRPLRGVESQGMLLLAENPDGKLTFVTPEDAASANGSPIT
jgi:methionyl-tRNA synthetase